MRAFGRPSKSLPGAAIVLCTVERRYRRRTRPIHWTRQAPPLIILRARGVWGRFTQHYSWVQIYVFQSVIGVPQNLQLCYNIAPRTPC